MLVVRTDALGDELDIELNKLAIELHDLVEIIDSLKDTDVGNEVVGGAGSLSKTADWG